MYFDLKVFKSYSNSMRTILRQGCHDPQFEERYVLQSPSINLGERLFIYFGSLTQKSALFCLFSFLASNAFAQFLLSPEHNEKDPCQNKLYIKSWVQPGEFIISYLDEFTYIETLSLGALKIRTRHYVLIRDETTC